MRHVRLFLSGLLIAGFACACDCGSQKEKCDLVPAVLITRPSSTVLTEFHDTNSVEQGVQYPVTVRTIGVPEGTVLSYTNDKRVGETVRGEVVLEDQETQTGWRTAAPAAPLRWWTPNTA
jgi:hypothetical protein